MGQAALDLPDPLQTPPVGPKASTDDLLSQLAGDEIDRLLAEADAGQPAVSRAPFHVAPPTGLEKEVAPPPAVAAGTLGEMLAAPPPPATPAAPKAPAVAAAPSSSLTEEAVASEMNALFSAATAKDEADAAAAAVARAAAEAEAETTAAERAGLQTPAGVAQAARPEPAPATEVVEDDDAPLPLYLRPLEWLNAPLAIFPPTVRDLIGKVAIVTLLNAVVILAYVLVVRRAQ